MVIADMHADAAELRSLRREARRVQPRRTRARSPGTSPSSRAGAGLKEVAGAGWEGGGQEGEEESQSQERKKERRKEGKKERRKGGTLETRLRRTDAKRCFFFSRAVFGIAPGLATRRPATGAPGAVELDGGGGGGPARGDPAARKMMRATRICGGEVELPAGVVTQPLLEDKSRESGLKLCDRFPLGLFHKHGVVAEYKLLVERIEEMLSASGQTKERKRAQKELFWKNYMRNSKELDMYASTMEVFTITMDFFIEFESAGLSISVCHRSRLAPESHQPLMEQWIEFVDKSYAPRDYKSQWSVASTFFMPICICFGTADLLRVVLPSVSVVKLLPERFPSSDIVLTIPSRVRSLLSLKMATAQYERFAAEVVSLPKKRFGHYDLEAVTVVVARHKGAFRRLGLDVFLCKLFTMAAEHRLFAWLEFVDLSVLPSYTPQYNFSPHLNAIADAKVLHRDSRTGERYLVTAHTRHLRRLQRHARNKRRLFCQKGPPTFWIVDQV